MAIVQSEMTGTVWKVLVKEGETVTEGQELLIIESMKMEIPVEAEKGGTVTKVFVQEGDFVEFEANLVELDE